MDTTEFTAPNIKCEGCAETITTALSGIGGVETVRVDVASKSILVTFDDVILSASDLRAALVESGFPPQ